MVKQVIERVHGLWALAMVAIIVLSWMPQLVAYRESKREAEYREMLIEQEAISNFMSVRSAFVGDTLLGQPVYMSVDREIHRPFLGSYYVAVREFPSRTLVCRAADGPLQYRADSELPEELTLSWWADNGGCSGKDLEPGQYIIETTWTKHNDALGIPDGLLTIASNPFHVYVTAPAQLQTEVEGLKKQLEDIANEVHR